MKLLIFRLILMLITFQTCHQGESYWQSHELYSSMMDILRDCERRVDALWGIRLNVIKHAPYELGYMAHVIQERYTRMVNYYISMQENKYNFYLIEHTLALENIERTFWEIEHILNMMHEIERKYKIHTELHEKYVETSTTTTTTTQRTRNSFKTRQPKIKFKKRVKLERAEDFFARLTLSPKRQKPKPSFFDWHYGWEVNYKWWE